MGPAQRKSHRWKKWYRKIVVFEFLAGQIEAAEQLHAFHRGEIFPRQNVLVNFPGIAAGNRGLN